MQAVLLVGGRGTRLLHLTADTPKPMLLVAGKPFLQHVVELLCRKGCTRLLFCTGYHADAIEQYFQDGSRFGITARYSREPEPLGTGGAIRFARDLLDDSFIVINGDTFFDISIGELPNLLTQHPAAAAVMALRHVMDVGRYGSVDLDNDFVSAFNEKGRHGPGWINGGVYCLRREAIDLLPNGASSLERDLFPALINRKQLCGICCEGAFIDIGVPDDLARATEYLAGH